MLNSDAAIYGGTNVGNEGCRESVAEPSDDMAQSLKVELPPLGWWCFAWSGDERGDSVVGLAAPGSGLSESANCATTKRRGRRTDTSARLVSRS